MEFGVHLPLIAWGDEPFTLERLLFYVRAARRLGFTALCANDHLLFRRPWLDGLTALAAALPEADGMALFTTVALPVVRGPVPLAKALAAIDVLSGGRLVVGVGPGSHPADHEAVGLAWDERWRRLDEAVPALRALWDPSVPPFRGRFYDTSGVRPEPVPARPGGPPIWIGSWGSAAGLRRAARLADGWLASAYNTTPEGFAAARARLGQALAAAGRDPASFPNAVASTFFHLAEDGATARRVLEERIAPGLGRPVEELRGRLPVGPVEEVAERLASYRDAGVQRVFLWPVGDEVRQLEGFAEGVRPLLGGPSG